MGLPVSGSGTIYAPTLSSMVVARNAILTWSGPEEWDSVSYYELTRTLGVTTATIATSTDYSYQDSNLDSGTYTYSLRAYPSTGDPSRWATATVVIVDHVAHPKSGWQPYRNIYQRKEDLETQTLTSSEFSSFLENHGSWWVMARPDNHYPCHHDDLFHEGTWHEDCLGSGYKLWWHKVKCRDMNTAGGLNLTFDLTTNYTGQTIWSYCWLYPKPRDMIFEVEWDTPKAMIYRHGNVVRLLNAYLIEHTDFLKGETGQISYARMFAHPMDQPWGPIEEVIRRNTIWTDLKRPY